MIWLPTHPHLSSWGKEGIIIFHYYLTSGIRVPVAVETWLPELKGLAPAPLISPGQYQLIGGWVSGHPPMPTNSATRAVEWREGYINRGNWGEHVAVRGSFGCMGEKGSRPEDGGHWQGTMEVQV